MLLRAIVSQCPVETFSISGAGSTVKQGNKNPGLERFHKHVYDLVILMTGVNHGVTKTAIDRDMCCPVVQMYGTDL